MYRNMVVNMEYGGWLVKFNFIAIIAITCIIKYFEGKNSVKPAGIQ